ncbi:P-loop containing nucleoside triphosphate hydrolase protein [Violaceomyces palustris]|uniref:P-loop containing nucleoside triphosphate hydrolase protein n=1 Tax=Violaceomyces palustris TaxID=1673888 RepID=A0ACD0NXD8_9BASI|nr:P-loop containing nucleoside triphosphate hydrolase protein [Violaceomyces palustris]
MEAGPSSRGIGGSSRTRRVEESIPRYIPAGTVTATCLDGKEVRFEKRKKMKGWKPPLLNFKEERGSGLLSRPIHRLLEDVEALKALEVVEMEEMEERRASTAKIARRNASSNAGKMWVDRYRPRKFTELLGDERIHRDVMSWLKEWDECVFKRKNPRRSRHQQYRKDAATAAMVPGSSAFGQDQSNQWRDPYGRPQERVLLISGPPGLGKTTLAHVIASQAGYNVFELNASDSRTASAVEDQIRMALESASMKDPRPTLVVIDEIDGATGGGAGEGAGAGFVKALIRLIEGGKGWAKAKKSFASSKAKPKKGVKPLLRPIICICNDLYAPSLRPLRPLARLIRFSKAPTNILVRRLREICEIEAVKADTRGLSLLSELTGGDIRSCLNALEFAKAKDIRLTEGEIRNASIGIKDTGTSVHKVWELLFRTQNRKAKDKATFKGLQTRQTEASTPWNSGNAGETKKASEVMIDSPNENLYRLVHEIQSCNEYEKLAQGCFEHYPSLRTSDDGWKRFERVHDWLDFGQNLHQKIWSGGHYELMGFLPWTFVPWHLLFANSGNALPEYPRVDYENYLKVTAFDEVATSLHLSLPPNLRSQFNKNSVVTELGPSLMRMLNPDLKLVNSQVVRPEQRATLDSLVKIMLSLNLSFVQDRNEDGQLVYKLEPPLDLFVQYDGKRSKEVGPGRFSVRQTIAKELETAALRIKNGMLGDKDDGNGKSTSGSRAIAVYKKGGEQGSNPLEEKKEKIAVDFFGRPIVKKERSKGEKTLQPVPIPVGMGNKKRKSPGDGKVGPAPPPEDEERSGPELAEMEAPTSSPPAKEEGVKVFYRYHEGYSNAVRKPLKLSSLL